MIKTWNQRMPARLPESANASVSITLDCMIAEIDELRAELANERDEVELKTACINGMRAAANSLAVERDALRAELEKQKSDWSRFHHLMKKHGLHPGRTDDDLIEILDAHIAPGAQPVLEGKS